MNATQISELLRPFLVAGPLVPEQLDAVSHYLDLLLRWNARTNLTAVRDEVNIVIRHFGESLFTAARLLGSASGSGDTPAEATCGVHEKRLRKGVSVVDVGSGAGFPGLPIKIYSPEVKLTLIESQNKKATFLKEVIRTLRVKDASVYSGRAESYDKMADLVTLRAVEQFERVLAVAARLVKREERVELGTGPLSEEDAPAESGEKTGRLALLIGATQHESARKALPHYCWENPIPIPLSSERILLVGRPAE